MSIRDYFLQGSGLIRIAQVVLTDAEIKALPTTPVQILPAPGSGKIVLILAGTALLDTLLGALTNVDATSALTLAVGNTQATLSTLAGFFELATKNLAMLVPYFDGSIASAWEAPTDIENLPTTCYAVNGVLGDFTGGDSTNILTVTVLYAVLDI